MQVKAVTKNNFKVGRKINHEECALGSSFLLFPVKVSGGQLYYGSWKEPLALGDSPEGIINFRVQI